MRGEIFGRFVQRTSWLFAVSLVLIGVPIPIQILANEASPPTGERRKMEQDRCKFLMEKAARELWSIGEALEGRSWVQRKKLKEIAARIEAIAEELDHPCNARENRQPANEGVASANH
jgi:hypothetical protein